ncbi:hypothetical protein Tco_0923916 [Tanacetum coccineum]|uniref:Polyprotein n=1 Tax=Tanacetum coccineum TaxID=301880 RepID=A0ABQ5D541_9ASTR
MATNEETNAAGTDTRPPMLVENDYESWKIRIHRDTSSQRPQFKQSNAKDIWDNWKCLCKESGLMLRCTCGHIVTEQLRGKHTGEMLVKQVSRARSGYVTTALQQEEGHFTQSEDAYDCNVDEFPMAALGFHGQLVIPLEEHLDSDAETEIDDNTTQSSVSFLTPEPKMFQLRADTLLHLTHQPVSIWDSEEVLVQQVVSMKKMSEKPGHVRPANGFYDKLNALKFVPQQELSREQAYWLPAK